MQLASSCGSTELILSPKFRCSFCWLSYVLRHFSDGLHIVCILIMYVYFFYITLLYCIIYICRSCLEILIYISIFLLYQIVRFLYTHHISITQHNNIFILFYFHFYAYSSLCFCFIFSFILLYIIQIIVHCVQYTPLCNLILLISYYYFTLTKICGTFYYNVNFGLFWLILCL